MTPRGCDRTWENDALREGRLGEKDADSFDRHRRACAACSAALARDERLRELGRALPPAEGPELVLRRMRSRILREISNESVVERRLQRSWAIALAALAASALFATLVLARGATSPISRTPLPIAAAATAAPKSYAGSASAALDTARQETPTAPGQEASAEAPGSAPPKTPPRRRVRAAAETDDGAAVYAEGIRQFREGRYETAAATFHAFASSHAQASEAEDASFLEAVALDRAGRLDAAALAAERHLEAYPRSFRARDASLLIARAASRRADCERVRAVLAPWSRSAGDEEIDALLRTCGSTTSNDPAP
jgi:hypothetical protein